MANEPNTVRNAFLAALSEYMGAGLAIGAPMISVPPVYIGSNTDYSELLVDEYLRLESLQKQIQEARATVLTSRNSSWPTVPINALPVEVLTRILQLVTKSKPCKLDPWRPSYGMSNCPIPLTHVCARWREIILHTPLFWSHIDIIPVLQSSKRLQGRTQVFLSRAAHFPLDIHLNTRYPTDEYWEAGGLQAFLSPLVSRMRCLDITVQVDEDDEEYDAEPLARFFCSSILSICFGESYTPGVLTEVNLDMDLGCSFVEASGSTHSGDWLQLDVPSGHLEDIWRHVTVLRLNNIFPSWTSSAYRGLLELQLGTSGWGNATISEHHLVNILSSSPQLRVLNLGLVIDPAHTPSKAVRLSDLEALILCLKSTSELECIMRLINPGPKSLHLTIHTNRETPGERFYTTTEAAKFFARSNINALHFVGVANYYKLLDLLNMVENLAFTISSSDDVSTLTCDKPAGLNPGRLHLLNRNGVDLNIGVLVPLVRAYAPRRLVLWGKFRIHRAGISIDNVAGIEEELSVAGTTAKVLISEPPEPSEYSFGVY